MLIRLTFLGILITNFAFSMPNSAGVASSCASYLLKPVIPSQIVKSDLLDQVHLESENIASQGGELVFQMYVGSVHIAEVESDAVEDNGGSLKFAAIESVFIGKSQYQGKGLGSILYLTLARKLWKRGYVLKASKFLNSNSARMWLSLEQKGYAVRYGSQPDEVAFSPQFLGHDALWTTFDRWLEDAIQEGGFIR